MNILTLTMYRKSLLGIDYKVCVPKHWSETVDLTHPFSLVTFGCSGGVLLDYSAVFQTEKTWKVE